MTKKKGEVVDLAKVRRKREVVDLAKVRRKREAERDLAKRIAKPGSRIVHMGIDVNVDKADDAYLERYILPFVTRNDQKMTLVEFRESCAELRRLGYEVIPTCPNTDERGRCKGCPVKIGGG